MRTRASLLLFAMTACHARRVPGAVADDAGDAEVATSRGPSVMPAETPAPVASAARDRTTDIDARIAEARALVGADRPVRVEEGLFVLVGVDHGPLFEASVKLLHQALTVLLDGRLAVLPDEAVTVWICSTPARFDALLRKRVADARWDAPYGLYHAATREIFVNAAPGITTLTHEIMHPLLQADFPRAPTWLVEGLASLYELPDFSEPGAIHGKPNFRRDDLLAALRGQGQSPRLDSLFALTTDAFRAPQEERLNYAMAREALRWLDSRRQLWPFYTAWREGVLADATGEKAFEAAAGQTPADANAGWIAWVEGGRAAVIPWTRE